MGGRIAIAYASLHPGDIQTLIIEDMDIQPRTVPTLSPSDWERRQSFTKKFATWESLEMSLSQWYEPARILGWREDGRVHQLPDESWWSGICPRTQYLALEGVLGPNGVCEAAWRACCAQSVLADKPFGVWVLVAGTDSCCNADSLQRMQEVMGEETLKAACAEHSLLQLVPFSAEVGHSIHNSGLAAFCEAVRTAVSSSFVTVYAPRPPLSVNCQQGASRLKESLLCECVSGGPWTQQLFEWDCALASVAAVSVIPSPSCSPQPHAHVEEEALLEYLHEKHRDAHGLQVSCADMVDVGLTLEGLRALLSSHFLRVPHQPPRPDSNPHPPPPPVLFSSVSCVYASPVEGEAGDEHGYTCGGLIDMRQRLCTLLQDSQRRVVLNYHMTTLGQPPWGGHFSPLGGYHGPSDSFLVLDTWSEPMWVQSRALWEALLHVDESSRRPRGWIELTL